MTKDQPPKRMRRTPPRPSVRLGFKDNGKMQERDCIIIGIAISSHYPAATFQLILLALWGDCEIIITCPSQ